MLFQRKSQKFILIIMLVLSILAQSVNCCHSSCICKPQTNTCIGCKDANSSLDENYLSCPCNIGYYSSKSSSIFTCESAQNYELNAASNFNLSFDACAIEIASKTKYVNVNLLAKIVITNSSSSGSISTSNMNQTSDSNNNININQSIEMEFSLDFSNVSLSSTCQSAYSNKLQYQINGIWRDINASELSTDSSSSTIGNVTRILIPFSKLSEYSSASTFGENTVAQQVHFQAYIGIPDHYTRLQVWNLYIYTEHGKTEIFLLDLDSQQQQILDSTDSENDDELIVVADLVLKSLICSDRNCTSTRSSNVYTISDTMFVKVWFADPSYTKQLNVVSAFMKDSRGIIYNVSEQIHLESPSTDVFVILGLQLTAPGTGIIIQINFQIGEVLKRNLQSAENELQNWKISQVQLKANVIGADSGNDVLTSSKDTTLNLQNFTKILNIFTSTIILIWSFFL